MATTAAPATSPTISMTIDLRARSLALAAAHGETSCSHAARTLGWTLDDATGELVSLALAIQSAHDAETTYAVGYSARQDDATCDCKAATHRQACWHRGLAILTGRAVATCYTPGGRAAAVREARAQQRMEANAEALTPSL